MQLKRRRISIMDYRSQGDQGMGNPCPNPIRVSAFSKPNSSPSPKDHHAPIRNGPSAHDHHHHHHHRHHHPAAPPDPVPLAATATTSGYTTPKSAAINYRECLRNHAAAIGGHVLDGCCEFMPGDGDPLRCGACDCHRSFHRKHTEGGGLDSDYHRRDRTSVPLLLPPPHPLTHVTSQNYGGGHHKQQSGGAFPASPSGVVPGSSAVVAFGGGNNSGSGATTGSSSEERLDDVRGPPPVIKPKKRFRTKFTAEQKEKMMDFAERVGWRMQRQDKATVEQLCREVGVRRQVLKVWMHNNKHSIKKQQQQQQNIESQQQQQQQQQQPMVVMRGEI